jgi:hypothetical protein
MRMLRYSFSVMHVNYEVRSSDAVPRRRMATAPLSAVVMNFAPAMAVPPAALITPVDVL